MTNEEKSVVQKLLDCANAIYPYCESYQDDGPDGEGWSSPEKIKAESDFLAVASVVDATLSVW